MDEVNLNFRAKQATFYNNGQLIGQLVGDDFTQFESLLSTFEQALVKTPEQIEAEETKEAEKIDAQIAELQNKKDILTGKISIEMSALQTKVE